MSRPHRAPTNLALRKQALQSMLKLASKKSKTRGRLTPRNQEGSYQDQSSVPGTLH